MYQSKIIFLYLGIFRTSETPKKEISNDFVAIDIDSEEFKTNEKSNGEKESTSASVCILLLLFFIAQFYSVLVI